MDFLEKITLGRYIDTGSCVHRLDPRTKLITLVATSIFILYSAPSDVSGILTLLSLLIASFFIVALSRISMKYVAKCILKFFWFFLFIIIFHSFFTSGKVIPLLQTYGIIVTYEGVKTALITALKLFIVIQCTYIFILTTSPLEITNGIKKLLSFLKIFKVPIDDIAIMTTLSIKFIPTFFTEIKKITAAQKARGVVFHEGSIKKRIKAVSLIITPIFYNIFKRAEELNTAMISRGYRVGAKRSSYKNIKLRFNDYFVLSLVVLFLIWGLIRRSG